MGAVGYKASDEFLRLDEKKMTRTDAADTLAKLDALVADQLNETRQKWNNLPVRLSGAHKFRSVQGAACHHDMGKRPNMEDDEIIVEPFANEEKAVRPSPHTTRTLNY
jgi:hypothetical protein